jgi:hypothetical protein
MPTFTACCARALVMPAKRPAANTIYAMSLRIMDAFLAEIFLPHHPDKPDEFGFRGTACTWVFLSVAIHRFG